MVVRTLSVGRSNVLSWYNWTEGFKTFVALTRFAVNLILLMDKIRLTTKEDDYPIIYRGSAPSQVQDFFHQQYISIGWQLQTQHEKSPVATKQFTIWSCFLSSAYRDMYLCLCRISFNMYCIYCIFIINIQICIYIFRSPQLVENLCLPFCWSSRYEGRSKEPELCDLRQYLGSSKFWWYAVNIWDMFVYIFIYII